MVMAGTGIAQIIGFALSPIISRMFSPSDFGVAGSFGAISLIIGAAATLEYSQAIMLPKEKESAINLLAISLFCTLGIGFVSLIVCLIAPRTINGLMKTQGVWALALLVFSIVAGTNQSCQAWSVRVKAFKHTSASQVIRSVASNGSKIGFGLARTGSTGLIISNILGNLLASINLVRVLLPDYMDLRVHIRWPLMKRLAKEYRDFPIYTASQNVINNLSAGLPILLLTRFYGISVAGAYSFGISVLQIPMGFVLVALRQVLFQKASESHQRGQNLATLYIKITAGLFAMVLLPSVILIIWAPQLFSWVFGAQWYASGEFSRSLVIWLAVVFCNLPAVLFARIIRMQRFVFFYDLFLLVARSLALIVGGLYLDALQTVTLFAIVGAVMNIFLIFRVGLTLIKKGGSISIESLRDSFFNKQP
jgi:lipopolysaccharide exporter